MAYCAQCGAQLVEGAKFCQKCGSSVHGGNAYTSQRQQEFAGKVYKCPQCGEVLNSFEINCPSCGYELRGTKASSAVREFAMKLEAIESRREYEKPRGIFAVAEALQRVSKTDAQKISLIKNFSVPNTKEDMLEFMILATSSINMRAYDSTNTNVSKGEQELNTAWFAKVQQVYEKAKRSYSSEDIFAEIKELYDQCTADIKRSKKKGIIKWALLFGWMPILFAAIFIWIGIYSPISEKKEVARLEAIVAQIEIHLENGEYKYALMNADALVYSGTIVNDEQERQWIIKREYWFDKVIDAAAQNGVILERPAEPEESVPATTVDSISDSMEEIQQNIDEFNAQMDGIKEQWDSIVNSNDTDTDDTADSVRFEDVAYSVTSVKGFSFCIPDYWSEEGSKNEYLQYYAEQGDKVVMLSIAYPEEPDDDFEVSFDGLYADNDNMVEAVAAMFTDGDVVDYEVFESDYGIKGILYHFTYSQKINWLKSTDGSGYCFCFPSEDDRRWFYVVMMHTNNVASDDYKDDYMALIATIKEKS